MTPSMSVSYCLKAEVNVCNEIGRQVRIVFLFYVFTKTVVKEQSERGNNSTFVCLFVRFRYLCRIVNNLVTKYSETIKYHSPLDQDQENLKFNEKLNESKFKTIQNPPKPCKKIHNRIPTKNNSR